MTQQIDQLEALFAPAIEALGQGIVLWGIEFQAGDHRAMLRLYVDAIDRQHRGLGGMAAAAAPALADGVGGRGRHHGGAGGRAGPAG